MEPLASRLTRPPSMYTSVAMSRPLRDGDDHEYVMFVPDAEAFADGLPIGP
jgi:hypothetical protein